MIRISTTSTIISLSLTGFASITAFLALEILQDTNQFRTLLITTTTIKQLKFVVLSGARSTGSSACTAG